MPIHPILGGRSLLGDLSIAPDLQALTLILVSCVASSNTWILRPKPAFPRLVRDHDGSQTSLVRATDTHRSIYCSALTKMIDRPPVL